MYNKGDQFQFSVEVPAGVVTFTVDIAGTLPSGIVEFRYLVRFPAAKSIETVYTSLEESKMTEHLEQTNAVRVAGVTV